MNDALEADEATTEGPSLGAVLQMRTSLDKFKFSPSTSSRLRRSARFVTIKEEQKEDEDCLPSIASSSATPEASRKRSASELADRLIDSKQDLPQKRVRTRGSSPIKLKKGYASPETYAHLDCLTDRLREELDGMYAFDLHLLAIFGSPACSCVRGYQVLPVPLNLKIVCS